MKSPEPARAALQSGVSVVIPAYNEEEAIEDVLACLVRTMADSELEYEIIVVDDGSIDKTAESSGPHHQDSGEAKIRESTAGVSRKPSSDCKACGCSGKHLCGLTAWNT